MMARALDRAEIYRKAAALCMKGRYASCFAVNEVVNGKGKHNRKSLEAKDYEDIFAICVAADARPPFAWGELWGDTMVDDKSIRDCRTLALCFMAAMVEAGDV